MSQHIWQWRSIALSSVSLAATIAVCCAAGGTVTASIQSSTWFQTCSATVHSCSQSSFLMGWISAMIVIPLVKWCMRRLLDSSSNDRLYGLDHAILNIELPPKYLWMNLGYWEHEKNLPDACKALLNEVLQTAGLLNEDGEPTSLDGSHKLKLVDVGFGCGDQTVYLTKSLCRLDAETKNYRALFDSYIGITLVRSQADFAQQRLSAYVPSEEQAKTGTPELHIFCANAADPTTWSPELLKAVRDELTFPLLPHNEQTTTTHTWLLALDTLYHFRPSRQPLFNLASQNLHASIMAFDLLLSDSASWIDRLLLRIICIFASIPFSNFVTRIEYEKMLVDSGYLREDVEIRDISEHVFSGIASYIQRREKELRLFGLSLGKFKVVGKLFGWWAKSGVVIGVIVVVRGKQL